MSDSPPPATPLVLTFGREQLVIRKRYEVLSIVNDILVAVWFLIGSVFFFYESMTTAGTWLFVVGSIELMIRPIIRLARRVHLRRVGPATTAPVEAAQDF